MIKERNLKSWAEFRDTIDEIRNTYGYHEFLIGDDKTYKQKNTVLFRGQASAQWKLETTLERWSKKDISLRQYISKTRRIVHQIESYTGTKWDLLDSSSLDENLNNQDELFGPNSLPDYQYWAYLRHHGYPSPLLDWSESPYIAAYFAMSDASFDEDKISEEQHVAIFAYIETTTSSKGYWGSDPKIRLQGPYVTTHKRHFIQKAWYTIAWKWSEKSKDHVFCSHEAVLEQNRPHQDILIKITVPTKDRKLAMKELDDYNINHFTLFQSEDALVRMLSIKDFDIGDT